MTRKTTQWPKVNKGDYHQWRGDFEGGPFVRRLLAKFSKSEVEYIGTVLFAIHVGPRSLTREQVRHIWPMLNTRISLIDFAIALLEELLEGKTQRVNEDIAALLTAAGISAGKSGEWQPEAVKKRRERPKTRTHLCNNLGTALPTVRDG